MTEKNGRKPMYILQFDGMLRTAGEEGTGQHGLLGYGWLIRRDHTEIARGYGVFLRNCKAGSNAAEYLALIDGLEALMDLRVTGAAVEIRGDAKCVIDQMAGIATVSSPLTKKLHEQASRLSRRFHHLTWTWVPRRENRHADLLSRRSFHYLRYSPRLRRQMRQMRFQYAYTGFIPLVDLRVLSAVPQQANQLENSENG